MRKLLFPFTIILFSFQSHAQVALDSMMTACYPFSGDAQDMSGNNHHGTVNGAWLTADRFGNPNNAYHFNGLNTYIEVQHFDSLVPTDEVSISFWCRVSTFQAHAQFQIQPDDAADRFNISVHYDHNSVPSTFWDYGSIFTTGRFDTIDIPFVTQWEHYVFISSASQDFMKEYKDGVLLKMEAQHDSIRNKNKPLWIGRGSTLTCMNGELDDIRFYNRVLNDSEITTLFTMTGNCSLSITSANFTTSDSTICQNDCISYNNISVNATSWQWVFTGGAPSVSTDENPQNICYSNPGSFDVTLVASNASGSDTLTFTNYITVSPLPVSPVITQVGDTLFSTQGFVGYQWYFGSDTISGATNYFYVITQSGNYNLIVTDENGCSVGAGILNVIEGLDQSGINHFTFDLFPNPAKDKLFIILNTPEFPNDNNFLFELFNPIGEKVSSTFINERKAAIDIASFSKGIYLLKISNHDKIMMQKIVLE